MLRKIIQWIPILKLIRSSGAKRRGANKICVQHNRRIVSISYVLLPSYTGFEAHREYRPTYLNFWTDGSLTTRNPIAVNGGHRRGPIVSARSRTRVVYKNEVLCRPKYPQCGQKSHIEILLFGFSYPVSYSTDRSTEKKTEKYSNCKINW